MAEAERDRLERMFLSHEAPADGYAVRGVVLFGLSEMARAQRCLGLLKRNDARGLGRLMNISHDGDRVSRETSRNTWRRVSASSADGPLTEWSRKPGRGADIAELSGEYGCSLPELDRIVDIARRQPGVEGAQLAGAGLGGCIMVLVQKPHTEDLAQDAGRAGHSGGSLPSHRRGLQFDAYLSPYPSAEAPRPKAEGSRWEPQFPRTCLSNLYSDIYSVSDRWWIGGG